MFNLYFINQPGVEYTEKVRVKGGVRRQGEIGFSSAFLSDLDELNGERSADVIEDAFGIIMNRDPNAISVCYISNANEKYTVSMTPWIVAHRFGHALSDGRDSLDSSLEGLVAFGDKVPFDRASGPYDNIEIQKLMTMRSVRTDEILISDVQAELIAQYLMNGKVTLKRGTKIDNEVAEAEIIINKLLRQILNACVGKIFVTV